MAVNEKLYNLIMGGKSDNSIRFNELCRFLEDMGLSLVRISGSHHIYACPNVMEIIDLQPDKRNHANAKVYQVKQVRSFVRKYLEG